MKRIVLIAAVAALALAGTAQAANVVTGKITFVGRIVSGTCMEPVTSARSDLREGAIACSGGGEVVSPMASTAEAVYQQQVVAATGHSGLEMLDYYVDNTRNFSALQPKLVTRTYD